MLHCTFLLGALNGCRYWISVLHSTSFLYAAAKLYPDGAARTLFRTPTGCSHHLNAEKHRYKIKSHYFELKGIKYSTDFYFRLDLVWVGKILKVFLKSLFSSNSFSLPQTEPGFQEELVEEKEDVSVPLTHRDTLPEIQEELVQLVEDVSSSVHRDTLPGIQEELVQLVEDVSSSVHRDTLPGIQEELVQLVDDVTVPQFTKTHYLGSRRNWSSWWKMREIL